MFLFSYPDSLHLAGFIAPSGILPSFLVPVFLPFPYGFAGDRRWIKAWRDNRVFVQSRQAPSEFDEIVIDDDSKLLPWTSEVRYAGEQLQSTDYHLPFFNPVSFSQKLSTRDDYLYAFGRSERDILFGQRGTLGKRIAETVQDHEVSPFLYLELCQFAKLAERIPAAIDRVRLVLDEFNPELAAQWAYLVMEEM